MKVYLQLVIQFWDKANMEDYSSDKDVELGAYERAILNFENIS